MNRLLISILSAMLAFTLPLAPVGSKGDTAPRVQLSRSALYDATNDPDDANQLVDSQVAEGTMWLSPKAVGWYADGRPITVKLYYPAQRTANRICFHLAQRPSAGALLPRSIDVFGGPGQRDEMRWLGAAHPPGPAAPDTMTYSTHNACVRFAARPLQSVEVVIAPRGSYFFIDEIEVDVSPGDKRAKPSATGSASIADPTAFALRRNDIIDRVRSATQSEVGAESGVPGRLLAAAEAGDAARDPATLDEIARALGRWRVRGPVAGTGFRFSAVDPFAPAAALDLTTTLAEPVLLIPSGQTDIAAASIVPVDARGGRFEVDFLVTGVPRGAFVADLSAVAEVLTAQGTTVADVLHPLTGLLEVPAGFQQMVWAAVRASPDAPAGTFPAMMTVRDLVTGSTRTLTWTIRSERYTPRGGFASVGWGYFDRPPLARAPQRAAKDLLDHGVNIAVLPASLAPWPVAQGGRPPAADYRASDRALDTFVPSQRILLFLGFKGEDYAVGQRLGTPTSMLGPEWNRRFTAWISAWTAHMRARGFGPEQIAFYPVDEPGSPQERALFVHLATLIRQAAPGWPIYTTLRQTKGVDPNFLARADIVQLDEATFDANFARSLLAAGKQTWLYSAEKAGKAADPATVYRALPWRAIAAGLSGAGVWSYSQNGDDGSPWDDLDGTESDRAMVYPLADGGWLSSRRWEAWRLGNQDAALLMAALERAATSAERTHVRQLAAAGAAAQHDPARLVAIRSELLALARPR